MDSKTIFKVLSFVGMALSGIGTLLSAWADEREQDAIIEEKVNEALAAREHGEKGKRGALTGALCFCRSRCP